MIETKTNALMKSCEGGVYSRHFCLPGEPSVTRPDAWHRVAHLLCLQTSWPDERRKCPVTHHARCRSKERAVLPSCSHAVGTWVRVTRKTVRVPEGPRVLEISLFNNFASDKDALLDQTQSASSWPSSPLGSELGLQRPPNFSKNLVSLQKIPHPRYLINLQIWSKSRILHHSRVTPADLGLPSGRTLWGWFSQDTPELGVSS